MRTRTLRRILTLAALTLLTATLSLAQTAQPGLQGQSPLFSTWPPAQPFASTEHKLYIVTTAEPTHRRDCIVSSVTSDQLVCRDRSGSLQTYPAQDLAAVIIPGVHTHHVTCLAVVLVAAVGLVTWEPLLVAGAVLYALAGAMVMMVSSILEPSENHRDRPDRLLYLAPGQILQIKLRY